MRIQTKEQEPNAFARVGRFAKVSAMVRRLDFELRSLGGNPNHDPFGVLPKWLDGASDKWWADLARRAGVAKMPSAKSIELFIAEYRERSELAAKVIETTGEVLDQRRSA